MATVGRRTTTRHTKAASSSTKAANVDPDQLAKDLSKKLNLNGTNAPTERATNSREVNSKAKGKQRVPKEASSVAPRDTQEKTPEQVKIASMLAVNAASQALSSVVQSGWKRSSAAPVLSSDKNTITLVQNSAADAAKHLASLRCLMDVSSASDSGDLDVERAAASVLAKLVALEMFDAARSALQGVYPRLCLLIGLPSETEVAVSSNLRLLSVPKAALPTTSPILLNILSTYLLCALVTATHPAKENASSNSSCQWIDDLATYLTSTSSHSLLSWIPSFQENDVLPGKQVDSLLTRAYTALTKLCSTATPPSNPSTSKVPPSRIRAKSTSAPSVASSSATPSTSSPSPSSLFFLRIYALRCLCHTSSGVIEPKTFWDQGVKFAATYVKTSCHAASSTEGNLQAREEATTRDILGAFTGLHTLACLRVDCSTFTSSENGFGDFCESWAGFAKRAGDISLLQRIHSLQGPSSPPPTSLVSSPSKPATSLQSGTPSLTDIDKDSTTVLVPSDSAEVLMLALIAQGVKIANALTQLSVVLEKAVKEKKISSDEQEVGQLLSLAEETTAALRLSLSYGHLPRILIPVQPSNQERTKVENQMDRVSGKVERAFERVRRLALKLLEMSTFSSDANEVKVDDALRIFLICCIECFEVLISSQPESLNSTTHSITVDVLTRTLDTLFILSRTGMNVSDPTTFVPVFELLMRGKVVLDVRSSPSTNENTLCLERSNLRRCLSGAFYNLAGTLYQAMRYGNAVAFLKEGCTMAEQALQQRVLCPKSQHNNEGDGLKDGTVEKKGSGKAEEWKQLEEQLFRRWELLGVCYSKAGDRRKSYDAFKRAIQNFPFDLSGLTQRTGNLAPDTVFNPSGVEETTCNPQLIKQLVALIDRVTYIGTCELFLAPSHVSLRSSTTNTISSSPRRHRKQSSAASMTSTHRRASSSVGSFNVPKVDLDPGIVGILLERQLESLEASRWKEGVKGVYVRLLQDALDVYSVKESEGIYRTPVRRARVMVRCLEFMYREGLGDGEFGFGGPSGSDMMLSEVETLCTSESFQADAELSRYTHQYRISANLWVALHAHKRGDEAQNTVMTMRSEEACRLIQDLLATSPAKTLRSPYATRPVGSPKVVRRSIIAPARPGVEGSTPKIGMVVSPPRTRMTRTTRVPAAPKKAIPGRKPVVGKASVKPQARAKASVVDPSTPKMKLRTTDEPKQTPPRRSVDGSSLSLNSPFVFDNFAGLLSLLQLVARLLGLLSLILAKAHLLDMSRKLAQRHAGMASDGYILACVDLAHGYVTLGKVKRAAAIFKPALEVVQNGQASPEASVRLLLRFSEHLAAVEDTPKSARIYMDAFDIWKQLDWNEQKSSPTHQRILARAKMLELTATAAHVFATIQYTKADVCASLNAFLQSLRLWNRAVDTLARLRPTPAGPSDNDPFEMASLKDALPVATPADSDASKTVRPITTPRPAMEGLDWRIFEGLLATLFAVAELYVLRGSAREADYFAKQAADLAEQLNTPAMLSRAFARQAEIQLHMGRLQEAREKVQQAAVLVQDMPGLDQADVRRLKVELKVRKADRPEEEEERSDEEDPKEMFDETVIMLQELDQAFLQFDSFAFGPRRSLGASPGILAQLDVLAPQLLSTVLSQQLWLLRDEAGAVFDGILERFLSLSSTKRAKAEEHTLMARLVMHTVYGRFRGDMFLSSLTESTIATPTGMTAKNMDDTVAPAKDILDSLSRAEKHLWDHLKMASNVGSVLKVRETTLSLVMIGAFRTSLGDRGQDLPLVMATLLDLSAALTLRRDMLEAISRKITLPLAEDLRWPSFSEEGGLFPMAAAMVKRPRNDLTDSEEDDDEERSGELDVLKDYWLSIRAKYDLQLSDLATLGTPDTSELPPNWTVINISLAPDNSSLFVCRREGGPSFQKPLLFCIPLKGRRDHGGEENEDHLTFSDAIGELQDIVRTSDECTKAAIKIKPDDSEARSNWWKQRRELDTRMRQLLENIEYCWLGAFKTILSPRPDITSDDIQDLRKQLEKVFHDSLHIKEKKIKKTPRKKNPSQPQAFSPTQFHLDDNLLRCLSTLSPKCRDEELEDLIYFVLDLYQLHGVPVAIAEVDIDQMVVDLRIIFEGHSAKQPKTKMAPQGTLISDEHIFLVLDKDVQGLPWESIPILRGRSVSRVPGVQFLYDRIAFAKCRRDAVGQTSDSASGALIDPRKGYFILNPSGDLGGTEQRFRGWAEGMQSVGWDGTIGKPVSEQQFINALRSRDLVVYFGHGGGEQYVRSHQIRNLPTCAATMLWGCSSGALKEMGEFDRTGTPYNYMLAGCPTLVANLWDVTDRDIDKFSLAVFDSLALSKEGVNLNRPPSSKTSLVTAVAQSRDSCKLKYLTGAAPVVYGIPFYL